MGTPDFAVLPLTEIIEAGFQVVEVVTNPDKPAGKRDNSFRNPQLKNARESAWRFCNPRIQGSRFLQALAG